MRDIFKVVDVKGNQDVRFLTLTDCSGNSENLYYVSLSGKNAEVDWQENDRIMLELGIYAYYNKGQWHICRQTDAVKLIEIDKI
ncbi:MAG: hypothetical protein IKT00_00125 [Prevotella sp.]|nr:hypothetical protein [Prevotella sp.]